MADREPMKRYLLFTFAAAYPEGGWNDFVKDFESIDEARAAVQTEGFSQIIDLVTGEEVE